MAAEHGGEGGSHWDRPRGVPGPDENGHHLSSFAPLPPDVKREHLLAHGDDLVAMRELTEAELEALHERHHQATETNGPDTGGQEVPADDGE